MGKKGETPTPVFRAESAQGSFKPILIISDARRPGDVAFFQDNVPTVITVRVEASQETRKQRGWVFASGVDDAESECGLDSYGKWDVILKNDDGGTCTSIWRCSQKSGGRARGPGG